MRPESAKDNLCHQLPGSRNSSFGEVLSFFESQVPATATDPHLTLLEMSRAIASHTNVDALVRDLGRRLHGLLDVTYLTLMIHDDDRDVMLTHTVHTQQPGPIAEREYSMEQSPSAGVWRTQQPLVVADISHESRYPVVMKSSARTASSRSALCPLPPPPAGLEP